MAAWRDDGDYRFFIFTGAPKVVNVRQSPLCANGKSTTSIAQEKSRKYGNVMWDPRVCRGTYVVPTHSKSTVRCDTLCGQLPQRKRFVRRPSTLAPKKLISSARSKKARAGENEKRSSTPPPVTGRWHAASQTKPLGEKLQDDVSTEVTRAVQTVPYTEFPLVDAKDPLFLVASAFSQECSDVATQCGQWEICDKDAVVRPISESLTNKIVERSLLEVMDEFELQCLVNQKTFYKQKVHDEFSRIELIRMNLIQAQAEGEMDKEMERFRREHEAHILLHGIHFTACYLRDFVNVNSEIIGDSLKDLEARNPVKYKFEPWLNENVEARLGGLYDVSRNLIDDMIHHTVVEREDAYNDNHLITVPVNSTMSMQPLNDRGESEYPGESDSGYDPMQDEWWRQSDVGVKGRDVDDGGDQGTTENVLAHEN